MIEFPEQLDRSKLYYSIGEVAKALDIEKSTLRFWEDEFQQLIPSKSPGGQRRYNEEDVETILKIKYLLKREKFTLNGARDKLNNWDGYKRPHNVAESIKSECNEALRLIEEFTENYVNDD